METVPTVSFASGEVIFQEGDASNSVYLIISGKVEISRQKNHKKVVLAVQEENTIFGEMALIDGKTRSATATALERTFCYRCSAVGILNEIKKIDPGVYKVMQNFAAIIREKNDIRLKTHSQISDLTQQEIIFDENIKEPYVTHEEVINNKELHDKVEKLSPFIKTMYRILMKNAFES